MRILTDPGYYSDKKSMRLTAILFYVFVISSHARGDGLNDIRSRFEKGGANRAGRCPNGAYINPVKGETCAGSQLPPAEVVKFLKRETAPATCDINELISVKQNISYILDQFYCTQTGIKAAMCSVGAAAVVYKGLRVAGGREITDLQLKKDELKAIAKYKAEQLAQGKDALFEIFKRQNLSDEAARYMADSGLDRERKLFLYEVQKIERELATKSAGKLMAHKVAGRLALGAAGVGTALLVADLAELSLSTVASGTLTDRYKTIQGFIEFAELSDQKKCEMLKLDGGLNAHFISMSAQLQNRINENLPTETTVKCGPPGGSTFALFTNKDGTSSLRSYDFNTDGNISALSGYELVLPSNPKNNLNFERAAQLNSGRLDGFNQKTFFVEVRNSSVVYSDPKTSKTVRDTDTLISSRDRSIIDEARRMALMAPTIYQYCRSRENDDAPSGRSAPGVRVNSNRVR